MFETELNRDNYKKWPKTACRWILLEVLKQHVLLNVLD